MANGDPTAAAASSAFQGAASGAAFGPPGAIIGAGLGLIGGLQGASADRERFRAARETERLTNLALGRRAVGVGRAGTRLVGRQRAAIASGNVTGAIVAVNAISTLEQTYLDQETILSGRSFRLQGKRSKKVEAADILDPTGFYRKAGKEIERFGKKVEKFLKKLF